MKEKKQKIRKIIILSIILCLISILLCFPSVLNPKFEAWVASDLHIASTHKNMLVHYISVGQGDAMAINFPDGKVMMIDTGPSSGVSKAVDYLNNSVLNNKHEKTIDYLILTHADSDHIGGTIGVLSRFNIKKIFMPTQEKDTKLYQSIKEYITNNNYNTEINHEGYIIDGAIKVISYGEFENTETNDSCPVVKMEYKGISFLFTGDISSDVERILCDKYHEDLDVDVLKVSHHGSKYSTSEYFLKTTTPKYAVISCGKNSYGHPTDIVINNLNSAGAKTYRTDIDGNVMFLVTRRSQLLPLAGKYNVTSLLIDYRIIILIIDTGITITIISIAVGKSMKKGKRKNINHNRK